MSLAETLRPQTLAEVWGQEQLLRPGGMLAALFAQSKPFSLVFWGPPGSGKTTLATLYAEHLGLRCPVLSAVTATVKELRAVLDTEPPLLFIDELHRFNKAQQDFFLPYLDRGLILLGATTENPIFHLNRALRSRLQLVTLAPLSVAALRACLDAGCRALSFALEPQWREALAQHSAGDARAALGMLEMMATLCAAGAEPRAALREVTALSAGSDDEHFALLSAFHKSLRGSSADGALYWFARLIEAGLDLDVLARRMLCVASEDIGNADPQALTVALSAWQAAERLGMPEARLPLAQAITYLALAPKSNASYAAMGKVWDCVRRTPPYPVPEHLQNAPTAWHQAQGFGVGYRYAHDEPQAFAAGQRYLPAALENLVFYEPNPRGFECKHHEKLQKLRQLDADYAQSLRQRD